MKCRIIEKIIRARKYWILQNCVNGVWMTIQQFPTLDAAVARKLEICL